MVDFMGGGACWGDRCFEQDSINFQSGTAGFMSFAAALDGLSTAEANQLLGFFGQGIGVPIGLGSDVQGTLGSDSADQSPTSVLCR